MSRSAHPRRLSPVVGLLMAGGMAACSGSAQSRSPSDSNPGEAVSPGSMRTVHFKGVEAASPYAMPDITLTADNGRPFNLVTDTVYPVTLVFFGYTHCPSLCPAVLANIATAFRELPHQIRAKTQVIFISVDPARDTSRVLRAYLDRFDDHFVGLTGNMTDIRSAASAMGVAVVGIKQLPGGRYEVGHGAQVVGFAEDTAPVLWTDGTPVSTVAADVAKLARK